MNAIIAVAGVRSRLRPHTFSHPKVLPSKQVSVGTSPGGNNEPFSFTDTATAENSIIGPNSTIGSQEVITDAIIRDSIIGSHGLITGNPKQINVGDYSEMNVA